MDRQKNRLMLTILIIALIQMPTLALTPGINQIQTIAFAGRSLGSIQTALAFPNLISPFIAVATAFFINRRLATKKGVVILGLCLLTLSGLLAVFLHTEFWHLYLLSVVLGVALGCFVSNAFGLLFDNFEPEQRQVVAGYQTSCINAGGIILSIVGGLLTTLIWYGGYLVLLVGLPVAVLAWLNVPNYKSPAAPAGGKKSSSRLHPKVFYYSAVVFVFMMAYSVCGSNISTHIAGIGNSATAGLAMAVQMGGGVVSGLFFGKLSKKLGDFTMALAFFTIFLGYLLLSLFPTSLVMTFAAVFIAGMALSVMLPRCMFMVSTFVDASSSAMATAIVTSIAPSFGGFLSPIVYTGITTALYGESTVLRYRFVSFVVLAFAVIIAAITASSNRKNAAPAAA